MTMNNPTLPLAAWARVQIRRAALRHNLQHLRQTAPASRVIAVVKANAYGHGMVSVAQTLTRADAFAVARLEEALTLRENGVTQPVILLEGFFCASQLPIIAEQQLHIVLHSAEQITALERTRLPRPLRVWLKLDSGMHRLGFAPAQINDAYARLCACRQVQAPVGVLSHFARADEQSDDGLNATRQQLACFSHCLADKPVERSLSASSGILRWPQAHFGWIRPGIALYGVSPFADNGTGADFGLQPAMTLASTLIAVRPHAAGETVGYGGTWRSQQATTLGVIALGYGDGYPQQAPSGTPVLVNGRLVPLVGRVSMDMICVDLGANSQERPGDPVILWGDGLPVEQIARATHTSAYELITRLTARLTYQYVD